MEDFGLTEDDTFNDDRRFSGASKDVEEQFPGFREVFKSEKTGLRVGRPKRSYVPDGRSCRSLVEALCLISCSEMDFAEIIGEVDIASMLSSSSEEDSDDDSTSSTSGVFLASARYCVKCFRI